MAPLKEVFKVGEAILKDAKEKSIVRVMKLIKWMVIDVQQMCNGDQNTVSIKHALRISLENLQSILKDKAVVRE